MERFLTEVLLAEAQIKRKVIESSQQLYALVDSAKFGKEDLTSFANPKKVAHLFTDEGVSPDWIDRLQEAGIEFTICKGEAVFAK